jgi:hypothetical protein
MRSTTLHVHITDLQHAGLMFLLLPLPPTATGREQAQWARLRQRALIVLARATGFRITTIAERLGTSTRIVYWWLARWRHAGVEGLYDRYRTRRRWGAREEDAHVSTARDAHVPRVGLRL